MDPRRPGIGNPCPGPSARSTVGPDGALERPSGTPPGSRFREPTRGPRSNGTAGLSRLPTLSSHQFLQPPAKLPRHRPRHRISHPVSVESSHRKDPPGSVGQEDLVRGFKVPPAQHQLLTGPPPRRRQLENRLPRDPL